MELDGFDQRFKLAVDEFAKGDPASTKALFSHRDDVTLANPFGPVAHGWSQVSDALDYASSRFREGRVTTFERVAEHVSGDLACRLELEHWQAKVGERDDITTFVLRVTTALRREQDAWKIIHRHADPITGFDPDGPMRGSPG